MAGVRRVSAGGQWPVGTRVRCPVFRARCPVNGGVAGAAEFRLGDRNYDDDDDDKDDYDFSNYEYCGLGACALVMEHEHSCGLGMDALVIGCSQT